MTNRVGNWIGNWGGGSAPNMAIARSDAVPLGVYIKLARGYFYEWTSDCRLTHEAAVMLFQHVFNMLLLRSMLETLIRSRDNGVLAVSSSHERIIVQRVKEVGSFEFQGDTFDALMTELRQQENHVAQHLGLLRLGAAPPGYQGRVTYSQ